MSIADSASANGLLSTPLVFPAPLAGFVIDTRSDGCGTILDVGPGMPFVTFYSPDRSPSPLQPAGPPLGSRSLQFSGDAFGAEIHSLECDGVGR